MTVLPKSLADVEGFLDNEWVACLATVDARSRPHVVPVWFTYDQGEVYVQTDRKSVKVKNLSLNPYVAVAMYNYRDEAVVIRGKAQIIKDEEVFRKHTQAHMDKYNRLFNKVRGTKDVEYIKLDKQGRDNMGIPLFDPKIRCVIEVTPTKILFW